MAGDASVCTRHLQTRTSWCVTVLVGPFPQVVREVRSWTLFAFSPRRPPGPWPGWVDSVFPSSSGCFGPQKRSENERQREDVSDDSEGREVGIGFFASASRGSEADSGPAKMDIQDKNKRAITNKLTCGRLVDPLQDPHGCGSNLEQPGWPMIGVN